MTYTNHQLTSASINILIFKHLRQEHNKINNSTGRVMTDLVDVEVDF